MESNSSLGFTGKNDINKYVWYLTSSLVFNPNVGFESQGWYWQWIFKVNLCTCTEH